MPSRQSGASKALWKSCRGGGGPPRAPRFLSPPPRWGPPRGVFCTPGGRPPGGGATPPDNETVTLRVLDTAVKILDADNKNAAVALFNDLGREVVDLSRRFGMLSLENVRIDRGARMKVTKDGGGEDWFSDCDSGARLRLRIALVIALLRVGAAYGVSTHPGLVMIDSPKAEEVQDLDATVLFRELAAVAEEQGIQVVITTRDYDLVHTVLDAKHTIEADENEPLW